jgi:nucleotide-binding universal stress UspA family protein
MRRGASPDDGLRILVATHGSPSAHAAVATARAVPWPARTRVRGVVVVGARATTGLRRAVLGSVADGTVNRSRVPVLVVR